MLDVFHRFDLHAVQREGDKGKDSDEMHPAESAVCPAVFAARRM